MVNAYVIGLGSNCYEQRVPDLIWDEPIEHKRAFLAGAWLGDGSWSYVNRGPSVVLEYGTVSRELADGLLRLLGELGVVARLKVGRTSKSTWTRTGSSSPAPQQVERLLDLFERAGRSARDPLRRRSGSRRPGTDGRTMQPGFVSRRSTRSRSRLRLLAGGRPRIRSSRRRPRGAQLFSERCDGPQAARRQHRLPVHAPAGGVGGERAAEAARRAEAEKHLGPLRGKGSRCSGSRSSRTPTTCARRRAA